MKPDVRQLSTRHETAEGDSRGESSTLTTTTPSAQGLSGIEVGLRSALKNVLTLP